MINWKEATTRLPGWVALVNPDTKSRKYKAPSGDIVGAWAYTSAVKHYERTGVVPQEPLGSKWKAHQKAQGAQYSSESSVNRSESMEIPIPGTDDMLSVDLPEPKSTTSSHRKTGLFTSKELASGYQSLLIICTSIIAMALQLPDAQMTELEVKSIAVPLGNITERSKYNRVVGQMIVDKFDYLQLGYAASMYIFRVSDAAKEKRFNEEPASNVTRYRQSEQPGQNSGSGGGISLRPTQSGLRGIVHGD